MITPQKFKLTQSFIDKYVNQIPEWGPVGYFAYKSHYARPIPEENRTEEWFETVRRVVEGTYAIQRWHCDQFNLPWNQNKAQRSAQTMYDLIFSFKFLPPGRGLWMMGTKYVEERGSAALNNCGFTTTEFINQSLSDPFTFLMDMSMLGVGVGLDTKGAGRIVVKQPKVLNATYIVEDTREGWVSVVGTILDAFTGAGGIPSSIDYSKIRPRGEPISSFGGTASGPTPLIQLVDDLQEILTPLIGNPITSSAIVDIANAIGACVVSGNVRRSAELFLGDPDDTEYINLKNPITNIARIERWGWASNNSVIAKVGMDYTNTIDAFLRNGEPGYFWLQTAKDFGRLVDPPNYKDKNICGANPCMEQSLESMELCNLVETFPAHHNTLEEYLRTLKFAYLYSKTVTLLPTHNPRTNAVISRNRRIGTSQSGIIQSIQKIGLNEHMRWSDEGYKYIQNLDDVYSGWLGVSNSRKTTSVKPSGTVSLLCGATPGIHYPFSEYYYRTMRLDHDSLFLQAATVAGYRCEATDDGYSSVVYFPVKEKNFQRSSASVTMWEQLELAALMQYWWADNQVSVTISIQDTELDQLQYALPVFERRLKGVSFLRYPSYERMLAMGYKWPAFIPITQVEYEKAIKNIKPMDLNNVVATQGDEKQYCEGDSCLLQEIRK